MKYHFLLFFFLITIFCYAQDTRLFQNDWQLSKLTIGDDDYHNPKTTDGTPVLLSFSEINVDYGLVTYVCDVKSCELDFHSTDPKFTILSSATTLGGCGIFEDPSNIEFDYFNFYSDNSDFSYSIQENSSALFLTIAKDNGDFAYYEEPKPVEKIDEGEWRLDELWVGFEKFINPLNSSGNPITTEFIFDATRQRYGFGFWVCESTGGRIDYFSEQSTLFSISELITTFGGCDIDASVNPGDLYNIDGKLFSFYNNPNMYSYVIIENGSDEKQTLIIASPTYDYAFYSRAILSNTTFDKNTVSIYPNPAQKSITVNLDFEPKGHEIQVYNTLGKIEIPKESIRTKTINVEQLSSGMYFLVIEDNFGNSIFKKFIKN